MHDNHPEITITAFDKEEGTVTVSLSGMPAVTWDMDELSYVDPEFLEAILDKLNN